MSQSGGEPDAVWSDVDRFVVEILRIDDAAAAAAQTRSRMEGLPDIAVSAAQGKLLQVLALGVGARRILEVGTLGGYSTIWLASALPADGRLVSLELDPHHAEVARANLTDAGLAERVDVRVGPAADSLASLGQERAQPFDMAFIDADKVSYPRYLELTVPLMRPGGLIVADNVVRRGRILSLDGDPNAQGARAFIEAVGRDPRLTASVVQTVGEKGYDGMLLAVVDAGDKDESGLPEQPV